MRIQSMYVFIYTAAGDLPRAGLRSCFSQSVFSPPFPSLLGDAQPARNAVDACISNATILMSWSHGLLTPTRPSHARYTTRSLDALMPFSTLTRPTSLSRTSLIISPIFISRPYNPRTQPLHLRANILDRSSSSVNSSSRKLRPAVVVGAA
eukprot:GHVU01163625.1.p1 GENE.GHVU01163625.1~~GHVU01163625.1.p1  ORF type:complete len:151 (-),score=0.72 GHVU01163625.1:398-850(-)